jgi:hypothetical protein
MDPQHDLNMRQLQGKAMLHDLLTNDEVISAEHPDKVTKLYNDISKLAPRTATQPLLMRAALRRAISQGQVDAHDADQLLGVENKIKDRDRPEDAPMVPGSESKPSKKD